MKVRYHPPPIPPEHGAWVLLAVACAQGVAAAPAGPAGPAALFAASALALHMARAAMAAWLRRRPAPGAGAWLGVWSAGALAGGGWLIAGWGRPALLLIALPAVLLFAAHGALVRWSARRRLDRTVWAEAAAVGGLALCAPGAYLACGGADSTRAALVWLMAFLPATGGVLYVKMLIEALRRRPAPPGELRQTCGRAHAWYHLGVLAAVFCAATAWPTGWLLAVAWAPSLVRAAVGYARLGMKPPPFKRVGLLEAGLALWYAGWVMAALRAR